MSEISVLDKIDFIWANDDRLSAWEIDFMGSIDNSIPDNLSIKQIDKVNQIYEKINS